MVTVTFYRSSDLLCGFKISGHSGYAEEGSDIVCAAVSSASLMVANTITDIQQLNADVAASDAFLSLEMQPSEAYKAKDILNGLKLHLTALAEQYKKYIKVKNSEV